MAKLGLNQSGLPKIGEEFEAITEGEELTRKEKLKTKWAALEALVGIQADRRRHSCPPGMALAVYRGS